MEGKVLGLQNLVKTYLFIVKKFFIFVKKFYKLGFFEKGKEKELCFAKLFIGGKITFSSVVNDIFEHWDVCIDNVKYDVKSMKKIKRTDEKPDQFWHWVEIKNVNGDFGWLYGKADYFAFELNDYWMVIKKRDLQDFIKENVIKEFTNKNEPYKLKKRRGRDDVITLVSSYDLWNISEKILKK